VFSLAIRITIPEFIGGREMGNRGGDLIGIPEMDQ
jgi:hypothetical protein